MDGVHKQTEKNCTDLKWAGLAIGWNSPDRTQLHMGILHRQRNSAMRMLHLRWHLFLSNSDPAQSETGLQPDTMLWIELPYHKARLRTLTAKCRLVWKMNKDSKVPYGFSHPQGWFDERTGKILLGSTQLGLTCATFVLAVFEIAGLRLLEYDDWPEDDEKAKRWQSTILGAMRMGVGNVPVEHIEKIQDEVGFARFSPEQVTGAGLSRDIPVSYEAAVETGELLIAELTPS